MLTDTLEHLCVLYNSALDQRKRSWEVERKSVAYYDQQSSLTQFRQRSPEVREFSSAIQRDPLRRVDLAFKAFFRRLKSGEKTGYPRFKAVSRYDSFTVDGNNFRLEGSNVFIAKLGGFRFKTKCKIKGVPKLLTIKRCGSRWIAGMACNIGDAPAKAVVSSAIGIDLGITSLATLSDGTEIVNPRWTKREEDRLATANKQLTRRRRGSSNWVKSLERLQRVHQRIAGLRNSYLVEQAKLLVVNYDLIAHENLNISKMVRSHLARAITDAAWGKLIRILNCEAEKAGKWVVSINPRNTSQNCSSCGGRVQKELSQRVHSCPCGLIIGRDHNAALNILALGESAAAEQNCALNLACESQTQEMRNEFTEAQ